MNGSITINIEGVGPILFEKTKRRARNLNISIMPSKPVRVSVPSRVSFEKARELIQAKLSWIRKHSDRMKRLEEDHNSKLVDVSHMSYAEKKCCLIKRVAEMTKEHHLRHNKILMRNQRLPRGSCSLRNKISLHKKLAQRYCRRSDYLIIS